jgi:hypothetical protein
VVSPTESDGGSMAGAGGPNESDVVFHDCDYGRRESAGNVAGLVVAALEIVGAWTESDGGGSGPCSSCNQSVGTGDRVGGELTRAPEQSSRVA